MRCAEKSALYCGFRALSADGGENIGIGDVDELDQDSLIEDAAEKGMANAFIKDLPEGYQTQLGTWFKNGKELSGGQWQKIALSRAFMRSKADVLILDGPQRRLMRGRRPKFSHTFAT